MTDADLHLGGLNVSRETIERLKKYEELLRHWNKSINLVARTTIDSIWQRHFEDSASVFHLLEETRGQVVDLGSGAGFPGAVIAILAQELAPEFQVNCIEADIRKCEFLRTVGRVTGVPFGVISRRIEDTPHQNAKAVTARALAPLNRLIALAQPHLAEDGIMLFHKGASWESELDEAKTNWKFEYEVTPSSVSSDSVLLKIGEVRRV